MKYFSGNGSGTVLILLLRKCHIDNTYKSNWSSIGKSLRNTRTIRYVLLCIYFHLNKLQVSFCLDLGACIFNLFCKGRSMEQHKVR